MKAKVLVLAGGVALSGAVVLTPPFSGPAQAATAPDCVKTSLNNSGFTDHLTVTNGCNKRLRLKVRLANRSDLPCHTYEPGYVGKSSWNWPGRFDGIETC